MKVKLKSVWHEVLVVLGFVIVVGAIFAVSLIRVAHGAEPPRSAVFEVLKKLPRHFTDKDEPDDAREARLRGIASAIESATKDKRERAVLIVLANEETHLARYVHEGRCSEGPRGAKECDAGKAVGLWQLQPTAQRIEVPPEDAEQAALAIKLFRYHEGRCEYASLRELAGGFSGYGSGGRCFANDWVKRRVQKVGEFAAKL